MMIMKTGATLLIMSGVLGNIVSLPPEPDPDPKTYGYIHTVQIVDEEDLPTNPVDFIKQRNGGDVKKNEISAMGELDAVNTGMK